MFIATLLMAALSTASAGDIDVGDFATVEIDATSSQWHAGLTLDAGCYDLFIVEGPTYTAWNAWGSSSYACDADGLGCRVGYLTDFRMRTSVE